MQEADVAQRDTALDGNVKLDAKTSHVSRLPIPANQAAPAVRVLLEISLSGVQRMREEQFRNSRSKYDDVANAE